MFRKKKTSERKKRIVKDIDIEEDDDVSESLIELKEEQQLRKKTGGVVADLRATREEERTKKKRVVEMLDGQFTGQSDANHKIPHENLMKQYIEEKLSTAPKRVPSPEKRMSKEEELYRIPDHLVVQSKFLKDSDPGGVLSWGTGIAEVNLPQDQVVTALEIQRQSQTQEEKVSAAPQNLSANYSQHINPKRRRKL